MNSREAFEAWCYLEWKNPALTGDIYTLMPSGIEKWVYDDNEVHSAWTGWQASRKQLLKELSEKEPFGYGIEICGEPCDSSVSPSFKTEFLRRQEKYPDETRKFHQLIIRPTEEE